MSNPRFSTVLCGMIGLALAVCVVPQVDATESAAKHGQTEQEAQGTEAVDKDVSQGALRIVEKDGSIVECPLKHTDVKADVSGFVARVNVTQTFQNPTNDTIEAVYVFPLPQQAAVDDMTMVIGERKIVGVIKRRGEARRIYEQALARGQTAALLEQERPNIFTQSVGNIAPGQEVRIQISYVDVLEYDMGQYEFYFPMVVGPRFIPGRPTDSPTSTPKELQGKVSPPVANTTRVPDAKRISPPVLRPEQRNGHDIRLTLSLDAGVPVQDLSVPNHLANIDRAGDTKAAVTLSPADSVPNKDFVVRYKVAGKKPEMAVLAHTGDYSGDARKLGNGYFMLMIQPQEDERLKKSPPREMVFLVDISGSMRGAKTDKTREVMQDMLGLCRGKDTVQVITFASRAEKLFEGPLPVNEASIRRALDFTSGLRGSGGTHMLEGVKLAIDEPIDQDRIRIVVMLTDGFIGNEAEIIEHVGKHCGDQIRFWTIGIGQSPNMFLVDGVAKQGGGMGKRLGLNDEAEQLSLEVMTRIQRAQLANVKIDWGSMQVAETYPARIPELWAGRPVILFGRYRDGGRSEIAVSGSVEGEPVRWPLTVDLPASEAKHDVLAGTWARRKIEELMQHTYYSGSPAVEEEVTAIALDYRLMSQYTSFVAVDEQEADQLESSARPPRRMLVPVPLPEGAEWEGFFGGTNRGEDELAEIVSFQLGQSVQQRVSAGASVAPASVAPARGRGIAYGGPAGGSYSANQPSLPAAYGMATPDSFTKLSSLEARTAAMYDSSRVGRGKGLAQVGDRLARRSRGLSVAANDYFRLREVTESVRDLNQFAAALRPEAESLYKAARSAWKSANELREQGDDKASRGALLRACFLDEAAANLRYSDGQIAGQALVMLAELHRSEVAEWTKRQPRLANRLDLVIRDKSIASALEQVARVSDVQIQLLPGSVDDAARITTGGGRISYLDLRGATVAEALDWILQPARLSWRLEKDAIMAGSARRLSGPSAWVYDVSHLVLPTQKELGVALQDDNQIVSAAKHAADEFLRVVRNELAKQNDVEVHWFSPGRLLVIGNSDRQTQAAKLLAALGDTRLAVKLRGEAGTLQLATAERARQRQEIGKELAAARKRLQVAQSHATFGWQLLASAAHGEVDDEAVTELGIAWQDPATRELLEGKGRALAMRSLWLVSEAARALPEEGQLTSLANTTLAQARPFFDAVLDDVEQDAEASEAYAALLYTSLALRDDRAFSARAYELLTKPGHEGSPLVTARLLAQSLLADADKIDAAVLTRLVSNGIDGEDTVALAAIACRRAGGAVWEMFRAASRDILGSQPLPGHVVVLIHRLPEDRLPLASMRNR